MTLARGSSHRKTSILDVAQKAGVSLGTVSRVINHHVSVSPDKRSRVLEAIDALGYSPDKVAQSMRSHRSMVFACVMRDFTVPVLSMFVDAMQKEIDSFGFSLMVASSYHDPVREMSLLRGFQQRRIDGLVIASSSETDPSLLSAMKEVNFPIVLIDRDAPNVLDRVMINHAQGVKDAVHHLSSLGHRSIAIITGDPELHPTRHRLSGYRQGMRACKLTIKKKLDSDDLIQQRCGLPRNFAHDEFTTSTYGHHCRRFSTVTRRVASNARASIANTARSLRDCWCRQ